MITTDYIQWREIPRRSQPKASPNSIRSSSWEDEARAILKRHSRQLSRDEAWMLYPFGDRDFDSRYAEGEVYDEAYGPASPRFDRVDQLYNRMEWDEDPLLGAAEIRADAARQVAYNVAFANTVIQLATARKQASILLYRGGRLNSPPLIHHHSMMDIVRILDLPTPVIKFSRPQPPSVVPPARKERNRSHQLSISGTSMKSQPFKAVCSCGKMARTFSDEPTMRKAIKRHLTSARRRKSA